MKFFITFVQCVKRTQFQGGFYKLEFQALTIDFLLA